MLSTKEMFGMVIHMKLVEVIGIRVIKTAIAVMLSIIFAYWLGLHSFESVGLLAILGIQVTKKQGIRNVLARIGASIASLLFGSLLFILFGFHIWVIPLYVLLVYPILHRLKLGDGIITGSVIFYHLYFAQEVSAAVIWNELMLLVIGLGTATLINIIYMPQVDTHLKQHKSNIELLFSKIFIQLSLHLRDSGTVWDGAELLEAEKVIISGLSLAQKQQENALFSEPDLDWQLYFFMRSEQLEMLERMSNLLAYVYQSMPQANSLADIFEEVADDVKLDYYIGRAESDLTILESHFKRLPMPVTRDEFEVRSSLLQLIRELKAYLNIAKKEQKQKKSSRSF